MFPDLMFFSDFFFVLETEDNTCDSFVLKHMQTHTLQSTRDCIEKKTEKQKKKNNRTCSVVGGTPTCAAVGAPNPNEGVLDICGAVEAPTPVEAAEIEAPNPSDCEKGNVGWPNPRIGKLLLL